MLLVAIWTKRSQCLEQEAPIGKRRSGRQCPDELDGVDPDCPADCDKLDDVHTPFATLVLGDEGLRFTELGREVALGKTNLLAGSDHGCAKCGLIR